MVDLGDTQSSPLVYSALGTSEPTWEVLGAAPVKLE